MSLALTPITGKRLTPFTERVLAVLRQHGPMRAAQLSRLVYPDAPSPSLRTIGATLGKLKRAGMVGWSVVDGRYFVR